MPELIKGHDAIFISSELGFDTLAIDISPVAVKNASKYIHLLRSCTAKTILRNIPDGLKVRFEAHDFFSFTDAEKFDLVYDYTSVLTLGRSPVLNNKAGSLSQSPRLGEENGGRR